MKQICNLSTFAFLTINLMFILVISCKTEDSNKPKLLPVLTTTQITKITQNTATTGGVITSDGGLEISERGVCWSLEPNPTTKDSISKDAAGTGEFTSNLYNLIADTTYYVRAYATNSDGTAYGLQVTFRTLASVLPALTTTVITDITASTAISGGNVNFNGGTGVTVRGVCWSTTQNPTILNNKTTDGEGIGPFTSNITNLTTGTTYYLRAYATNRTGTGYGSQTTFKTQSIPTLSTITPTSITISSSVTGGNIDSDGGAAVIARGVCWSTTSNPTITDNKTLNGDGSGAYTSSITGLSLGTTYYVRAYATNIIGTAYGNQTIFNTQDGVVKLETSLSTCITTTTSNSGGTITSDGGSNIISRGVCWSTSANPTIALSTKTSDGSGIGTFTSSITNLTIGTSYYIRAYATNEVGTFYGSQEKFTQNYAIGMSYLGGKIAYIDDSGKHGFVCALADQSINATWWNGNSLTTNAINTAIEPTGVYGITKSGGRKNTDLIIAAQGAGIYAASICAALTIGGSNVGEWYLPSKEELNQLYINKSLLGGFENYRYWSSSESSRGIAWHQEFARGSQSYDFSVSYPGHVRAIRAF